MSSDPGRNDGESGGATSAQDLVCQEPTCGKTFARKKATGRTPKFCSRACKSRADRARAAERQAAAAAPGEQPLPATALPVDLAEASGVLSAPEPAPPQLPVPAVADRGRLSATMPAGNARRLVQVTEAVQRRALAYLEALQNGDPVAAFQEFAEQLTTYNTLLRTTGRDLRDEARWPDLTHAQRHDARMREEWGLPEDWHESEKAEAAFHARLESSRGETPALSAAGEPPAVSPRTTGRGETTPAGPLPVST
ncbi:hypothetical protein [Kitasatospora aureofaciens]|uniref:hypothetical protein n=1 Tax=Kitasatospora aureofaciens TaxID=1894 RepID=UPI0037CB2E79